ncbi:MAG: hypothetical protein ACI4NJ_09130 [Cellvibrio sp.]
MSTIILSSNQMSTTEFKLSDFGKEPFLFGLGGKPADHIKPYTPYCIGQPDSQNAAIIASLSKPQTAKCIADGCRIMGVDTLLGLAEVYAALDVRGTTVAAAAFSAGGDAHKRFVKSLSELESALLRMHQSKGNVVEYGRARREAETLSRKVNHVFSAEVNSATAKIKSRKGVPLKDFTRAENIAKSSRNIDKLNFLDLTDVQRLTKLSTVTRVAGNSMLAFDLGVGVSKTYSDYKQGGNWHKTMFVESMKLGSTAAVAGVAAKVGGAVALTFALTPAGWIVIAAAAAGLAVTASMYTEHKSGEWYDGIMEWLS